MTSCHVTVLDQSEFRSQNRRLDTTKMSVVHLSLTRLSVVLLLECNAFRDGRYLLCDLTCSLYFDRCTAANYCDARVGL